MKHSKDYNSAFYDTFISPAMWLQGMDGSVSQWVVISKC